jgi:methylenetetrahydrofolate dehydrogenase (NADP+)/methenyltetrahydrofolate cyclohydrolase
MQELIEKYPEKILDGKTLAKNLNKELKAEAKEWAAKGMVPKVATLSVGDDPASAAYLRSREKQLAKVGFESMVTELGADALTQECIDAMAKLNADESIDAIMLQLPMPDQVNEAAVVDSLNPEKDIDGIHPVNVGRLHKGLPCHVPNTPAGVIRLLEEYNVEFKGIEAVIVGRSNIVGKPMGTLLLQRHATVTTCHSRTKDLAAVCRRAELLISATGFIGLIGADHVSEGAILVDVGINYDDAGNMRGDIDFEAVIEAVKLITPVPGGIGPMTNATILRNIFELGMNRRGIK